MSSALYPEGAPAVPAAVPSAPAPAWSYSGNPGNSLQDQVRFLIGDTDPRRPLLYDGEIIWLLTDAGMAPLSAAIRGVETIIAKLARSRDESVGSVSIRFSQELAGYEKLMQTLTRRLAKKGIPYAGGISRSDKLAQVADSDRVPPSFIRNLFQDQDDPESDGGLSIAGDQYASGDGGQ